MSALSLADAKKHLNITVADYDTELQTFIDSAEATIAQRIGPLSTVTVTARVPGYGWNLHLPIYPAVSLTSITVVGSTTTLTLTDLYLEQDSGTVSYNGSSFFSASAYDVVYVAGRSPVPADLLMAVKKRLKLDWADQRGGARPGATTTEVVINEERKLEEILARYDLLPGLA